MSDDFSPDAAEFRSLVAFPDGSESFVHGFEAGMIWQRMVSGEQVNRWRELLDDASAAAYDANFGTILSNDCGDVARKALGLEEGEEDED